MMWKDLPTPCYVVDEGKIRKNLEILADLEQECGCHILLAQKAFSMYSLYPMIGQYISGTTASGLYEARLGYEEMGKENHVFAPAYKEKDMEELVQICDHIIFNSFAQYEKYKEMCRESAKVRKDKKAVSVGIRINPQCSTQEGHEIYDPCGYASRLGVTEEQFREDLLEGVEGLHFHTLCEQDSDALETTLRAFDERFGGFMKGMKWLNFGGGHHITREGYDVPRLERCIRAAQSEYGCEVYLEPGEAVVLNAGTLVAEVLDVVHNGIDVAVLDASAACHMPDVLEMPYRPPVCGLFRKTDNGLSAKDLCEYAGDGYEKVSDAGAPEERAHVCRLAGATCLAGDVIGDWSFDEKPQPGDCIVFGDMALYTMVKTNTFNGTPLPGIYLRRADGSVRTLRTFGYADFESRL